MIGGKKRTPHQRALCYWPQMHSPAMLVAIWNVTPKNALLLRALMSNNSALRGFSENVQRYPLQGPLCKGE